MSSRRSKVIGSLKHLEYFEGQQGVPKGRIVFPAPTCSSPKNSQPASPEKSYQAFLDGTEHLSMPSDAAGDITFMDSEHIPEMGKRVNSSYLLEVGLTI